MSSPSFSGFWGRKMFDGFRRERKIRQTLRQLRRQRVVGVLQPGSIWMVERALGYDEDTLDVHSHVKFPGIILPFHFQYFGRNKS